MIKFETLTGTEYTIENGRISRVGSHYPIVDREPFSEIGKLEVGYPFKVFIKAKQRWLLTTAVTRIERN